MCLFSHQGAGGGVVQSCIHEFLLLAVPLFSELGKSAELAACADMMVSSGSGMA